MTTPHPTPNPEPPTNPHHQSLLNELINGAADLARRVLAESNTTPTPENPTPAADATIPYERAARTLRRTLVLAHHLARGTLASNAPTRPNPAQARAHAREQVIRNLEDAIHRSRDTAAAPALLSELHERLEDPEFENDLDSRPLPELIEEIARDLGVAESGRSSVWPRRTPHDIQDLRARARNRPRPTPPAGHVAPALRPRQPGPAIHPLPSARPSPATANDPKDAAYILEILAKSRKREA